MEKAINPVMGGGAEREGGGEVERWETLAGWGREGGRAVTRESTLLPPSSLNSTPTLMLTNRTELEPGGQSHIERAPPSLGGSCQNFGTDDTNFNSV